MPLTEHMDIIEAIEAGEIMDIFLKIIPLIDNNEIAHEDRAQFEPEVIKLESITMDSSSESHSNHYEEIPTNEGVLTFGEVDDTPLYPI